MGPDFPLEDHSNLSLLKDMAMSKTSKTRASNPAQIADQIGVFALLGLGLAVAIALIEQLHF